MTELPFTNDKLRRGATYASVTVAFILILAKLAGYFITDSVAMLSSLADSTVDMIASLITAYGVANALRPPDREHRFGHGKYEALAALVQAAFIVGSAVLLFYEALSRIYAPHVVQHKPVGYAIMIVALVLTFALLGFQRYVIRRTGSLAIHADHLHYAGDLFVNLAVIAAMGLEEWTGLTWMDPAFAMAIALGLVASAYHVAHHAMKVLMDHELPESDRAKILSIITAHKDIHGAHDLRTRSDGDRAFIEFHIELDRHTTVQQAHDIAEAVTTSLKESYANADIMIHQDPAGIKEERLDTQIEALLPSKSK